MFDRYHFTQSPRGPSRVDVHEHRAPTDKSIALLREMEAAAEAKIIASVRLAGNGLNGSATLTENCADATMTARVVFDLNGRRCVVKEVFERGERREDVVRKLVDATSRTISAELLSDVMRGLL